MNLTKEFPTTTAYRKKYILSVYFLSAESCCQGPNNTQLTPAKLGEALRDAQLGLLFVCLFGAWRRPKNHQEPVVTLCCQRYRNDKRFVYLHLYAMGALCHGCSQFCCFHQENAGFIRCTVCAHFALNTYLSNQVPPRKVKEDLSAQHVYIEDGSHETREAAFKHYHFTMFCGDFSSVPFPPLALVYSLAYVAHVPR